MCAQKVLIVDEDATGRIVGEVLDLEGCEVRYERNRRRAIDFLLQTKQPHLVFIRYMPPTWIGFDWSAMLTKSRQLQRHAYVEICRCTLRDEESEEWAVRERFAIPVLPCPFTYEHIMDETEHALTHLATRLIFVPKMSSNSWRSS
jgi:DNA-binding response OmpR family regulator